MCYSNYLVTPKGYYFKLNDLAMGELGYQGLQALEDAGCIFCLDKQSMLQTHIDVIKDIDGDYDMDPEELDGTQYTLAYEGTSFFYFDDRGFQCTFSDAMDITAELLVSVMVEFEL